MRIDLGIIEPVARMNQLGVTVDRDAMRRINTQAVQQHETALTDLQARVGSHFNPGSSQQVGRLLFEDLGLIPPTGFKYTAGGVEKSDTDTLLALASDAREKGNAEVGAILGHRGDDDHAPAGILGCRALSKRIGTYTAEHALLRYADYDERLRTSFSATTARTGRLASHSPNLQNIDPVVRAAFMAQTGCVLVSLDLSQIEMVWSGELSQDAAMLDIFINGHDMHVRTACAIFGLDYETVRAKWAAYKKGKFEHGSPAWLEMRTFEVTQRLPAKTIGFAILYGASADALQVQIVSAGGPLLDIPTIHHLVDEWYKLYAGVREWMDLQVSRARRFGCVWTAFGRPRVVPEVRSSLKRVSSAGERKTGNTPIQGSAGDHLKIILAQIYETVVLPWQARGYCELLLQVHDELVFEVAADMADEFVADARLIMEGCVPLSDGDLPVKSSASKGVYWSELK